MPPWFLSLRFHRLPRVVMPAKLEEITATYLSERHRFPNTDGDVVIATAWANTDINAEITIKGQADIDELQRDQTYRFYGRWTTYKNRRNNTDEKQFAFTSFVRQQPHSRQGVIQYLRSAGEGNNFSVGKATKCWELFGSDAVKMLREQPEHVAERLSASGRHFKLSADDAKKIAAVLDSEAALEGCTLDLMDLLTGRGFPKSTARLATRAWGNKAAQIIRRNPYRLMEFRGCGFKKTDSLYLDLGLPPAKLKRQALCAWHTLARDTEGHTFYPVEFVQQGIKGNISATDLRIEDAITLANRAGYTSMLRTATVTGPLAEDGQRRWLAEGKKAENERELSELICEAMLEPVSIGVFYRELVRFPGYRVGTDGTVWSCWSNNGEQTSEWKELKTDTIKGGYQRVRLRKSTMVYEAVQVSHLVLEAFIGPRPIYISGNDVVECVACHGDSNPENNSLENLRWDSRQENEDDKKAAGTHQTGSGNPAALLDEATVLGIRSQYEDGDISTYKLASIYGVSRTTICDLINRKTWSHI